MDTHFSIEEQASLQLAGWAASMPQEDFLDTYKMVSQHTWPTWRGHPEEGCRLLLQDLSISKTLYMFGRSKLFIKTQKTVSSSLILMDKVEKRQ